MKEGGRIIYTANKRAARAAATLFAVILLAFLLVSATYSVISIDHDCHHEHCLICHNVHMLWMLLDTIAKAVFLAIFILWVHSLLLYIKPQAKQLGFRLSPVRLFDRMND